MTRISAKISSERQQQSWRKSRQKLTEHLRRQAEWYLGTPGKEILKYRHDYEQGMRRGWKPSQKMDLLRAIHSSSTLLLGDFHGYVQSQRSSLRLLRSLREKRTIILLMECFDRRHQSVIDEYCNGDLSEESFLQKVSWSKNWPYPWIHYRGLVQWAIKSRVSIVAWSDFGSSLTLQDRDRRMAQQMNELSKSASETLVVGIVGELHLVPEHLPHYLKSDPVIVFQDLEHVYFNLVRRSLETSVDVVRRTSKQFCVFTAPPWVKWQSFLFCLETADDRELRQELEPTDHVLRLLRVLESDLNVEVKHGQLQVFTAQTLPNRYLRNKHIKKSFQSDQSFYLPAQRFAYLSRISVNHAAYVAGLYMHSEMSGLHKNLEAPRDFLRRIWQESLGFFACKMINHKRAANTVDEIRGSLTDGKSSGQTTQALKLALQQRMNEISQVRNFGRKKVEVSSQLEVRLKAAQLVGFMLGERMYLAFRRNRVGLDTIFCYFCKDVFASDFPRFYYEVVRALEPLDRWARDRSERL